MKALWFTLASCCALTLSASAAIPVPLFQPVTFDQIPAVTEWSTRMVDGAASSVFNTSAFDAMVQTNSAAMFTSALLSDSAPAPQPHTMASWSSVRQAVFTGPAGVAASMLLTTLSNASGANISSLHVGYDLGVVPVNNGAEEIPGQRVYFSLSGAPGTWQPVPQLSGQMAEGFYHAWLSLGSWPANGLLYLLWAQDNAAHSPDSCYTIDNFYATSYVCDSFYWLQPFNDITCIEGDAATFSINLCWDERFNVQWLKNGVAIPGATNRTLQFPRVQLSDSGSYRAALSNATQQSSSRTATLTVQPDTQRPRALIAYQVEETNSALDTIAVFFSERVNTNSAQNLANYSLRSFSASNATPAVLQVLAVSETNVVLQTANLTPGVQYYLTISNVLDQAVSPNVLDPNPTMLDVQTFQPPIIAADSPWKLFEALTNTSWPGWMNPGYNDDTWNTAPGAFGLPLDEVLPAPFTIRTMILTPDAGGPITHYFRGGFFLPTNRVSTNAVIQLSGVFDDGAAVYVNGREVWRVRLPAGFLTTSTLATNAPETFGHPLDGPVDVFAPGLVRAGWNSVAVGLHQYAPTSGDAVMGIELRISRGATRIECDSPLNLTRGAGGAVTLTWSCVDSVLQASGNPNGASGWQDVQTSGNSFTTNINSGVLFFRLRSR